MLHPVLEVGAAVEAGGIAIFPDEVLQRGPLSPNVEREALVGDLEQKETTGRQSPVPMAQGRKGKRHVLENVAGNHKVEAAVAEGQLYGVGHDIGEDELLADFRVRFTQVAGVDAIEVPDSSSRGNGEFPPESAYLDAPASQMAGQHFVLHPAERRSLTHANTIAFGIR